MKEIDQEIYEDNFEKIFNWFHDNVHVGPEYFRYDVIELPRTFLKMIDIVREQTKGLYFRVILKATYDDVDRAPLPIKNYKDITHFQQKTHNEPFRGTALQVCYVQLDKKNNPIHGILYTYSPDDEKYHRFELPHQKENDAE